MADEEEPESEEPESIHAKVWHEPDGSEVTPVHPTDLPPFGGSEVLGTGG